MSAGPSLGDVGDYVAARWEILLLRGKVPAISANDGGHGVLDATTDIDWLTARWRPGYNIGARVPEGLIVIDTDPRHGGEDRLQELAQRHQVGGVDGHQVGGGGLPDTLTCFSGRGDGGRHRYFLHPGGHLSSRQLPAGVDLKTRAGYVVVPPSLHPATGKPYRWANPDRQPQPAPEWLVELLRPEEMLPVVPSPNFRPRVVHDGDSIADWFTAATTWEQILGDAGWHEVHGGWRHPTATAPISATVRHDLLFVYSSNTPLEQTEPGAPHGYTRFRAWAVLEHRGDLSAAAKAARTLRGNGVAA